ncbi:YxeA family protein [Candidatus Enterococcus courvalinii]|uniref:YxeA family protein n=1 Tax=Candidatus Enterococcus courvalinii TaxID=2815329 RepID=A0ABS3HX75_9ENTE|nr:YxeA family protein [Enterococcus sp. MSG2901]MBO0481070.1 YxeA family protein [Enterococcus sp. MSG2901]
MKKVIGLVFLALLAFGGFKGYQYYQDTYVGEVAYAHVPNQVPAKVKHKSESGIGDNSPWYSYDYDLTFVKEDGETEKRNIQISNDNAQPLVPNSYVKVTMSKKRIIEGPNTIDQKDLPEKAKNKLVTAN